MRDLAQRCSERGETRSGEARVLRSMQWQGMVESHGHGAREDGWVVRAARRSAASEGGASDEGRVRSVGTCECAGRRDAVRAGGGTRAGWR